MPSPTDKEIIASCRRAGMIAAGNGLRYSANPFPESKPEMRLAWSEGHNRARAAQAQNREMVRMRAQH